MLLCLQSIYVIFELMYLIRERDQLIYTNYNDNSDNKLHDNGQERKGVREWKSK